MSTLFAMILIGLLGILFGKIFAACDVADLKRQVRIRDERVEGLLEDYEEDRSLIVSLRKEIDELTDEMQVRSVNDYE